jgi:hypothetical protein
MDSMSQKVCILHLYHAVNQAMRNPFKKSNNKTPEGEPLERIGDLVPSSKKLVIIAAMVESLEKG